MKVALSAVAVLLALSARGHRRGAVLRSRFHLAQSAGESLDRSSIKPSGTVDAQDHAGLFTGQGRSSRVKIHTATIPPIAQCCAPAPAVLEFDQAGNPIRQWAAR
jgi:hypothetical protein